ncbi:uncharacterized protein DNG_00845 [Cephalotrichum gorgonifer]|uniref:Meiotically up-regulated 65 protein n=1 Tax=Cephalotrichum gorgonifer TaxID=2041049 RepID=A0AAE8SR45_9PEZI|nr:uncharacterized protein DNG_00845 [Cephalotrichum gorgonifer]
MPKLHTSRRVSVLKESDYDHEIDLIDHDTPPASPQSVSRGGSIDSSTKSPRPSGEVGRVRRYVSSIKGKGKGKGKAAQETSDESVSSGTRASKLPSKVPSDALRRPSIEIQEPTPHEMPGPSTRDSLSKTSTAEQEAVIDVLYENERGGFLCGIPLFSSKALGNLDPSPWTNSFHKVSPTDIHTAQVPDPTWEWAWPEWRVHHHDDVDEGGWEYSFMFAKAFSWHGPRWWNSFVRRRAWIRKRVKVNTLNAEMSVGTMTTDQRMLNPDYFSGRLTSDRSRSLSPSPRGGGSRASIASRLSGSVSDGGFDVSAQSIEDVESLLYVLRRARIDREKLEAVGIYVEQGGDLQNLGLRMHDIMSIFVFQASRKLLLSNLTQSLDKTIEALGEEEESPESRERRAHLEAAVRSADKEVRSLAYWSDIKGMVESGESAHAVTGEKGWGEEWQGVDQSGPAGPRREDTQT